MKMAKTLALCLTLAVLSIFTAGCEQPPDPATVAKVDPLSVAVKDESVSSSSSSTVESQVSFRRNFYFVLDDSSSMAYGVPDGGDQEFNSKMEAAKWAMKEFLKSVPADVNLGLALLNRGEIVALGANNRDQLLKAIDEVEADGGTPLGRGIEAGVEKLIVQYQRQMGYGEFRLIVVTDGESGDDLNWGLSALAKYDYVTPMYTIGFGVAKHALAPHSVSYQTANSASELKKGLEEAASEMPDF